MRGPVAGTPGWDHDRLSAKSKTTVEQTIDISTRDGYSLKIHVDVRG